MHSSGVNKVSMYKGINMVTYTIDNLYHFARMMKTHKLREVEKIM